MKIMMIWVIFLFSSCARAAVGIESGCYQKTPESVGRLTPFFYFQSYRDDELGENVGALVSYNNLKDRISLVYFDEIQGRGQNEGGYQKFWLEIVGKKIAGQYVERGSYLGNLGGKSIEYTNFSTKKTSLFRLATIESPCAAAR